jgi:hypothetical protein
MTFSRRKFLRVSSVAALTAGATMGITALGNSSRSGRKSSAEGSPASPRSTGPAASRMTRASFAACLNSTFQLQNADASVLPLKLVELKDTVHSAHKKAAAAHGKECFSLAFTAPNHEVLKQNTYRLEHENLGKFDLFISPVTSKRHGEIYEAIINHVAF